MASPAVRCVVSWTGCRSNRMSTLWRLQIRCLSSCARNTSFHEPLSSQPATCYGVNFAGHVGLSRRTGTLWPPEGLRDLPVGNFSFLSQTKRWNSTASTGSGVADAVAQTAASPGIPPGYIPAPPVPPPDSDIMGELAQQLNALGEPTLQSLGLGSWYPPGLVQSALEALHVGLDVPWWTAIVIGTVMVRLAMFPLVIFAQRSAANMHNHMPIFQKLQEKFRKARQSGDQLEAMRTGSEAQEYQKKHKFNPGRNFLPLFAQAPVFVSVFVGLRKMANLPVESMKTGGLFWFTDLTVTDPYFALPLMTAATFFITLELGVDGVRASSMTSGMRTFMRVMPVAMLPLIINFPAALLCYWLTSNTFSLFQVLFLKIPGIRQFFKIPEMVVHDKSVTEENKKPFVQKMRQAYRDSKKQYDVEAMQRQEATRFKEAGLGAIPKTFPYDPTKVQSKKVNR